MAEDMFVAAWRQLAIERRHLLWQKYDIIAAQNDRIRELEAKVDALTNEINAVEWMNGRIEKELFDCRKR